MIKVSVWTERGFERVDIDPVNIRSFSLVNQKTWTTKGSFKTWYKTYRIRLKDGKLLKVREHNFKELKEIFKEKYTSEKQTESEYKNGSERTATDWHYTINV